MKKCLMLVLGMTGALFLAGCDSIFSAKNPVGPVPGGIYPAPTPDPCPFQFSFEKNKIYWTNTSWCYNLVDIERTAVQAACGSYSIRSRGAWTTATWDPNKKFGLIQYEFFPKGLDDRPHFNMAAQGGVVSAKIYLSMPLPAGTEVALILARYLATASGDKYFNWTSPYQGVAADPPANTWVKLTADYSTYAGIDDVQQLLVIVTPPAANNWDGYIYIDDVDW